MRPTVTDIYAAARSINGKPGTIRAWVHRGELTHRGYDRHGRVLVELNELEALNKRKRQAEAETTAA